MILEERRRHLAEAAAIGAGVLVVYLTTLAANHTEAEDALRYATEMRDGRAKLLLHASHLVYTLFGNGLFRFVRLLGYNGGPLLPAQIANAVLGALGIALLWLFLRPRLPLRVVAITCSIVAFSYGYWWYSVELEVYVVSVVLLITALWATCVAVERPSGRSFALVGALVGLAMLAHATNVLFLVVVGVALWRAHRLHPRVETTRIGLVFVAALLIVVLPAYAAAATKLQLHSPRAFISWTQELGHSSQWGNARPSNIPKAVSGASRAAVGGHSALALDVVPKFKAREERFLVRNYPTAVAWLLLGFGVLLLIAAGIALWGWRKPRLNDSMRTLTYLCVAWLTTYALFFLWWDPINIEFWVASLVPAAILISMPWTWRSTSRRATLMAVGAIGVLFVTNLFGSVLPQHHAGHDYWHVRTAWYRNHATRDDVIITSGYVPRFYLEYETAAHVIDAELVFLEHDNNPKAALAALERRVKRSHARRVLLTREALFPASDPYSSCNALRDICGVAAAMRTEFLHRSHVVATPRLERVWQLDNGADG